MFFCFGHFLEKTFMNLIVLVLCYIQTRTRRPILIRRVVHRLPLRSKVRLVEKAMIIFAQRLCPIIVRGLRHLFHAGLCRGIGCAHSADRQFFFEFLTQLVAQDLVRIFACLSPLRSRCFDCFLPHARAIKFMSRKTEPNCGLSVFMEKYNKDLDHSSRRLR